MLSRDEGLSSGWREFCRAVKHETRYLFFKENEEVEEQDREFVEPGRMLAELGSLVGACGLFRRLEAGSEYWRVRWDKEGKKFETPSEMGPPPESKARQSRMSAAGIPAFYLAEKPETALAETRDAGRGTASYGKFKLLRDLTVLELVKIPRIPSILNEGRAQSRPSIKFLHEFVRDISKPIERDENVHFEYTPTQVVTEYFRRAFRIEKETTLDGMQEPPTDAESIVRRTRQVRFDLNFIIKGEDKKFVYWLERRGRGVFLRASPIDVSGLLQDKLFEKVPTVVLTSATLSSAGNFNFIRERLGLDQADEMIAESIFDFETKNATIRLNIEHCIARRYATNHLHARLAKGRDSERQSMSFWPDGKSGNRIS